MRPAHTHGSAHQGDLVARHSQPARRQVFAGPERWRLPQGAVRAVAVTVVEGHEQVAGLLGRHSPDGCAVTPSTCTRRVATSITNSTYRRLRNTVSTVKQVHRQHTLGLRPENSRHETAVRCGAASTPARCRMLHTVLARSCRRDGTARRGRGDSPRSGSLWPSAAPETGPPPLRWDGHAGEGRPSGAAPGRDAIAAAWPAAPTVPARPSVAGAAKAGQHRAVGPVNPRSGHLSAEHRDLVPQHQQLRVLGRRAPRQQRKPSQQLAEGQIEQS
jgi:hypothetical protein